MFDLHHTLALLEDGAYDEAASRLRQVLAQMPAYAPAYVLLAQAYEALGRWPAALATWQRAHFFAPNSPVVEAGLLRVLDRADATLDEASDGEPFEVSTAEVLDRLADELIETIRDEPSADEPDVPPAAEDATPREDASPEDTASSALSPLEELARRQPSADLRDGDQPLSADVEDLERLIDELEGARIDPQPDLEAVAPPELDSDIEDMVSETLARIYIAQQQYAEAARVYQRLAAQAPEQADEYREKAAHMRARARGEGEEGS